MNEPFEIKGHQVLLSEGRIVWAGERDDSWYISFDNGKGAITKLRISYDAADALLKLLSRKDEPYERILKYIITAAEDADLKWTAVPAAADDPSTLTVGK